MNLYIFNPEAKNAKKLKNKIKNYLAHLNLEGEFVEAKKKEDVAKIATEALERKLDTVVAIGGDGIVNRVIQVIAGENISMAVIPVGETNFLASFLGINNWRKGCEVLVKKEIIGLNLGRINDEKFFISSVELESQEKNKKGLLKRIFHKKGSIKKYSNTSITINNKASSLKIQTEASSIMISSVPFPPSPDMDLREIMEKEEFNIIIKSAPTDKDKKSDEITLLSGKDIEISSKNKLSVKTDGEKYGKTDIKIEMLPKTLNVVIPKKRIAPAK